MEEQYEVKPMKMSSKEKAVEYANELLGMTTEYKNMKKRYELLDSTMKTYMIENDLTEFKVENGNLALLTQQRSVLDRKLIDDIEKYKVNTVVKLMYKNPKE